jgi:hypothetical protein
MKNTILEDWQKEARKTHGIWFDFCNHMKKWYYKEVDEYKLDKKTIEYVTTGKMIKEFDVTKMIGYDCMCRVEKYAEKHKEIKIISVDDDVYSSSNLVLIPHPQHGITAIFIPQNTNINNQFFLYPSCIENIQEELDAMKKKYAKFEDTTP